MCGIAGIVGPARHASQAKTQLLEAMCEALSRRGPDDRGIWSDELVGLCHTRLSIVDLSNAGHQPMVSGCGRYVLVFNGEIYNHRALRDELTRQGCQFRGHSDTEVFLEYVSAFGLDSTLSAVNGMFALALWDKFEQCLELAIDRAGEKPLYYADVNGQFMFASEPAALMCNPDFNRELDPVAVSHMITRGWIPAPLSIFKNSGKLTPASRMRVDRSRRWLASATSTYWTWPDAMTSSTSGDSLEAVLSDAIALRLQADVPVGVFLSGGIDSSVIAALASEVSSEPVHTFTVGFEESAYDEAPYAREIASVLGTQHSEYRFSERDLLAQVPSLPEVYSEPFADASQLAMLLVSEGARKHVKVALSGDGGDELFGGYRRHLQASTLKRSIKVMPHWLRNGFGRILRNCSQAGLSRMSQLLPGFLPGAGMSGESIHKFAAALAARDSQDLYQRLLADDDFAYFRSGNVEEVALPNNYDDTDNFAQWMMQADAQTYLPYDILTKVDRASMYHGLEVRAPFLDSRVIQTAAAISINTKITPAGGKRPLRDVLATRFEQKLFDRPKTGFAVPLDSWLRGPLKEWAESTLKEGDFEHAGMPSRQDVMALWNAHENGNINAQYALWNLLVFLSWKGRWLT